MHIQLTICRAGAAVPDRDVVVESPQRATAGELARALGGHALSVAGRQIGETSRIGMPPLLDGTEVTLDDNRKASSSSPWELWVLDGPDTGLRFPLPAGRSLLGRLDDATVVLTDPRVSRRHAEIHVRRDAGAVVRDVGGTNGTRVRGELIEAGTAVALAVGDVLIVGDTRLQLRAAPPADVGLQPDGEGHLLVAGRLSARPSQPEPVRFPDALSGSSRARFPLVALVVPLLLAGVLAAVTRSPTMLLFGLTGPVLSLGAWLGGRRRSRDRGGDMHVAAVAQAQTVLGRALQRERETLHRSHPPLAEVLTVAESRSAALWRGSGLEVRVGVGTAPSRVRLEGDTAPSSPRHHDVPVTVDLSTVGVLGVCGAREPVMSTAATVVARLATSCPPSGVELLVIAADSARAKEGAKEWAFVARLPHTRAVCAVGDVRAHVDRLVAEIAVREEADRVRAPPARPSIVVVVDGWSASREARGLEDVLRRGPAVGVVAAVLTSSRSQLPECGAILAVAAGSARLTQASTSSSGEAARERSCLVRPDHPGHRWATRVSRALAPLREVSSSPGAATAELPVSVRLLDLVGDVDAADVAAGWKENGSSTQAVLGVTSTGPLRVDLAVDGPHALVAGTTGAGKSELLQTLVCSLALANRPDELTFLLVDYKGGAAFRGCAALPHVVGVVTDLDGHLTARALTSLTAELRRRERLFADAGAGSVEEYRLARATDPSLPAVPRLVIAIDEFRVLAEELPDFVHGLVRLAAVGRSLGVHLVLSTQRPGGIVSPDIRANVSLRIALRVRDRTDSIDVLDAPDAASIDAGAPGRAMLRGASTPLTRFQSAQVTSVPSPSVPLTVTELGRSRRPEPHPAGQPRPGGSPGTRDLDRIVAAVRGATAGSGISEPGSPWLPPLPYRVDPRSLGPAAGLESIPVGLEDVPGEQRQAPWSWSMTDGHLGIAGAGGSGRTSAVLTVAAQLARCATSRHIHLYAIGPVALSVLTALPQVAGVADVDDAEHVRLVVERLGATRSAARVVLLVDGWERLVAHAHGALAAEVRAELERSSGLGLRAVVTGGRAVLAGQLASVFGQRLVLAVNDPVELAMAGIPARAVPSHQPPGRALDARTHREVQVAWLGPDPASEVAELAAKGPIEKVDRPSPVRRLPPTLAMRAAPRPDGAVLVGVRDGDLEPVGFSLANGERRIVVVGPRGSGRSTGLTTLAEGFLANGHPVALVGRALDARIATDAARHRPVISLSGSDPADVDLLVEARRRHPDLVVIVDDADHVAGVPIEPVLLEIARRADEHAGVVVAATTTMALEGRTGALAADLARAHTGLVLWPAPGSVVLGVGGSTNPARLPGRGLLVTSRGAERVQVVTVSPP